MFNAQFSILNVQLLSKEGLSSILKIEHGVLCIEHFLLSGKRLL